MRFSTDMNREPNQSLTQRQSSTDKAFGDAVVSKVSRRLIPVLIVAYVLAYLDRVNVGVAALTMREDLILSASVFGLGVGLFFIGYAVFEVPSNLALHRVGARLWLARILVSWGLIAGLTGAIQGEASFYAVRFLLGVAEAGFFPGVILYISLWFPAAYRAKVLGLFVAAVPVSIAFGAPLSGLLLKVDWLSLPGWRWLFIIEGVPTVLFGLMLPRLLPNRPADAKWLSSKESAWLQSTLDTEADDVRRRFAMSAFAALFNLRVLALAFTLFAISGGLYALSFWMPQILHAALPGQSNFGVTVLTAIPFALGAPAMVLWGRLCDKIDRPAKFTAMPLLIGGAALAGTTMINVNPWVGYFGLCVCALGVLCAFPTFWKLPGLFLTGAGAAVGIAWINSLANLSGFFGPYWIGAATDAFGSARWGLAVIGVLIIASVGVLIALGDRPRERSSPSQQGLLRTNLAAPTDNAVNATVAEDLEP